MQERMVMIMKQKFMKVNLHSHTYRCNHADGTEREYVEKAIESGLKVLGFADHSPQIYPVPHKSGMRMKIEEAAGYAEVINGLKKEYERQIKILLGFEVEYYPLSFDNLCNALEPLDYDYFILAQHFTKNEFDGKYVGGSCNKEHLGYYVQGICQALDRGFFTYVAHPDLPPYMEDMDYYREQMTRICKKAKEKNVPLEINLLGMASGRIYPRKAFFEIAAEVGNTAILGLAAHEPNDFKRFEVYERALKFADEVGINLVDNNILLRSPKGEKMLTY